MATASAARSLHGNQKSCSICVEPFKGRNPKILQCFHTFCLACLAQLAEKARTEMVERQKVLVSTNNPDTEAGTEDIFITCPSCHKDIQVPAEGVQKFQTNFYLDQGEEEGHVQPMLCDLCDQGQLASHCCTKCQTRLCFHCHRTHDPCPQPAPPATAPVDPSVSWGEITSLLTTGREQVKVLSKVNSLRELVFGTLQPSSTSGDEIMLPADNGDFDPHLLFGAGVVQSSPHTQVQHAQQGHADIAALSSRVDDLARKLEITVKKVTESESREKRLQVEMRSVKDELRGVRDKNSFVIQDLATVQGESAKLREDVAQLQRQQQSSSQDSVDRQQTGASNTDAWPQKASGQEILLSTKGGASSEAKSEAVAQEMSSLETLQIKHLQDHQKKIDHRIDLVQDTVRCYQKSMLEMVHRTTVDDLRHRVDSLEKLLSK